jgi:hypothetical protein
VEAVDAQKPPLLMIEIFLKTLAVLYHVLNFAKSRPPFKVTLNIDCPAIKKLIKIIS